MSSRSGRVEVVYSQGFQENFAGLHQALEAELRWMRPLTLRILEATALNEEYTKVRLDAQSSREIRFEHRGWRWKLQQSSESKPPSGEVAVVDEIGGELVLQGPFPAPNRDVAICLFEPDYQRLVREWAEERAKSSPQLPSRYFDLLKLSSAAKTTLPNQGLLRPAQDLAVSRRQAPLQLVWGPPGTGKTYTMGTSVAHLSLEGIRCLVLAPSNTATDTVCLAIDEARNRLGVPLQEGELLRPGRPIRPELEKRTHLLGWTSVLAELGEEIRRIRLRVAEIRRSKVRGELEMLELAQLSRELDSVERQRARHLWELARGASIIVTTLTAGLYHGEILAAFSGQPAAVFFDEASMVSRFMLAAYVTILGEGDPLQPIPEEEKLLPVDLQSLQVFGDFRQLSTIRRNPKTDPNSICWVGHSLFDCFGVRTDSDVAKREAESHLVMLNQQSRMHETIARPVSRQFYRGKLQTVEDSDRLNPPVVPDTPATGVVLADPKDVELVSSAPDRSRFDRRGKRDELGAWSAVSLALRALQAQPKLRVLLISPFREQASLLRKLVSTYLSSYSETVQVGTVHVSQGMEADLVIFDPVRPGHKWLQGGFGDPSVPERLFCVAFSRARAQMVVMLRKGEVNKNHLLRTLTRDAIRLGASV